jgi:hypothetical protein
MRAAHGLRCGFGHAEMPDLARLDQFLDGSSDIFDRHIRVDAMLVEQVYVFGVQPFKRGVTDGPDIIRSAIHTRHLTIDDHEAELRRDYDIPSER